MELCCCLQSEWWCREALHWLVEERLPRPTSGYCACLLPALSICLATGPVVALSSCDDGCIKQQFILLPPPPPPPKTRHELQQCIPLGGIVLLQYISSRLLQPLSSAVEVTEAHYNAVGVCKLMLDTSEMWVCVLGTG